MSLDLTAHTSPSPIRRGFAPSFVNYRNGAAASDNVYQLLAQGQWFSPASSTTKTGRHDIAEILLKVALKHQKSINLTILQYMYLLNIGSQQYDVSRIWTHSRSWELRGPMMFSVKPAVCCCVYLSSQE